MNQADVIKLTLEKLVRVAAQDGFVVTVEQRPLVPLAMGRYETVVEVRAARVPPVPPVPASGEAGGDCAPNHTCGGRMVHVPIGEACDRCGWDGVPR